MTEMPRASTREHDWYAAMCLRLDTQTGLLAQILDQLPKPATVRNNITVDGGAAAPVQVTEPAGQPAGHATSAPAAEEPARPARRRATKSTTSAASRRGTASKE